MSVSDRQGFALVEVVIAAGILACSVAVAALVVPNGTAVRHRAETLQQGRIAVDNEFERLATLPFCTEGRSLGASADTLIARVFPHAVAARNTGEAFYQGTDSGATRGGTFVCVREDAGGMVRTTARFLVSGSEGWVAVEPSVVEGFEAGHDRPPSSAVEVTASWSSGHDTGVCETTVVFVAP